MTKRIGLHVDEGHSRARNQLIGRLVDDASSQRLFVRCDENCDRSIEALWNYASAERKRDGESQTSCKHLTEQFLRESRQLTIFGGYYQCLTSSGTVPLIAADLKVKAVPAVTAPVFVTVNVGLAITNPLVIKLHL